MPRLNWVNRQGPGEFEVSAPTEVSYEFDYSHQGGVEGWPTTHCGVKFGPALIKKAWASGLFVFAEVDGYPYPMAVKEAKWCKGNILEVKLSEGPRVATRIFTRRSAKGLTVGGLLIE